MMRIPRLVPALAAAAIVGATLRPDVAIAARPPAKPAPATVEAQLLAVNDFHGNLEATVGLRLNPATGGGSGSDPGAVPAGGAEYLASHIRDR